MQDHKAIPIASAACSKPLARKKRRKTRHHHQDKYSPLSLALGASTSDSTSSSESSSESGDSDNSKGEDSSSSSSSSSSSCSTDLLSENSRREKRGNLPAKRRQQKLSPNAATTASARDSPSSTSTRSSSTVFSLSSNGVAAASSSPLTCPEDAVSPSKPSQALQDSQNTNGNAKDNATTSPVDSGELDNADDPVVSLKHASRAEIHRLVTRLMQKSHEMQQLCDKHAQEHAEAMEQLDQVKSEYKSLKKRVNEAQKRLRTKQNAHKALKQVKLATSSNKKQKKVLKQFQQGLSLRFQLLQSESKRFEMIIEKQMSDLRKEYADSYLFANSFPNAAGSLS